MAELQVPATVEKLDEVIAFVGEQLEAFDCPFKVRFQIELALEEIYVNIAHYAYNPEIGLATVRCTVEKEPQTQVTIELLDSGKPYDPLARQDPNTALPAEERDIGGLGIFLVKKNMDHVAYRYEDGKNILVMKKSYDAD